MTHQVKDIKINYSEYAYFTTLSGHEKLNYFFQLFEDIDILYQSASVAVSFNLLNPINNIHHEGFFYVHPGLVLDMLIEKYQNIILRNNYSKDVYTVTIYKI